MFCLHTCTCTTCVPVGAPGTGVMDGCEPTCGHWESNLGPGRATSVLNTEPAISLATVSTVSFFLFCFLTLDSLFCVEPTLVGDAVFETIQLNNYCKSREQ